MPKLYYPTPDELQGAVPLNENLWMRQYQGLMLALVNTKEGKDLLCIEDYGLPIIGIRKNAILYDHGDKRMVDFRVGAKWGNVVRYRWQEIKRALERVNELWLTNRPQVLFRKGRMLVPAGATALTIYPNAHVESTSVDGQVHRANVDETLSAIRSGNGTGSADDGTNGYFQVATHGASTNQYLNMTRCMYGFDTSAMGPSTIDSATLSLYGNAWDQSLGLSDIALVGAAPATNTALVAADYQTASDTSFAPGLTPGDDWNQSTSTGSYNVFTLNSTGEDYIETGGVTNFGVRLEWDRANSFGGSWYTPAYTHHGSILADQSGTSTDPKLIVNYTEIPFIPRVIMF